MRKRAKYSIAILAIACTGLAFVGWKAAREINGTSSQGHADTIDQIPLAGHALAGLPIRGPMTYFVFDGLRDQVVYVSGVIDEQQLLGWKSQHSEVSELFADPDTRFRLQRLINDLGGDPSQFTLNFTNNDFVYSGGSGSVKSLEMYVRKSDGRATIRAIVSRR